jgi:3-deoxy-D-manno-octulosonate 8-phosphate phosphatase (KDO 8-P phosphatase)
MSADSHGFGEIRLLLFDVDGVLTDGTILIHADGSESKSFNIRDGAGIVWAQRAGLSIGLLSARTADATAVRAAQLGIKIVSQGGADKLAAYERVLADAGLSDNQVGYMGDDLQDLPVLRRAGFSAAPADAAPEVRAAVQWVSQSGGGRGAARECIEHVLRARGTWQAAVAGFLDC